jgi:Raf kinase inhibitor-like YbhB/YbcL family protein
MRTAKRDRYTSRLRAAAFYLTALLVLAIFSCRNGDDEMAETTQKQGGEIQVSSTAFEEGGMIPAQYTCDGADISPPLSWQSVPEGTRSIALISDDPDAPMGTFVHWVLYDLPADMRELQENVPDAKTLPNGAKQGANGFGRIGYGGPCPPSGTHRYFFKIYTLDAATNLAPGQKKAQLLKAMEGHILAQGQIMGKYRRR